MHHHASIVSFLDDLDGVKSEISARNFWDRRKRCSSPNKRSFWSFYTQKLITRAQFRPFYVIFRQNCVKFRRASFDIVLSQNFTVVSPDFGDFSHVPKIHDLAHTHMMIFDDFRCFFTKPSQFYGISMISRLFLMIFNKGFELSVLVAEVFSYKRERRSRIKVPLFHIFKMSTKCVICYKNT